MPIERWETLRRVTIANAKVFRVEAVERRSPDGQEAKFFVAEMPDWVNVVAITPDDHFVLIRQYRQGTDSITLEIPGGVVDEDESFLDAARRELREETGYEADELHEIGVVHPNPALQNNRTGTVLALGATLEHDTAFDEHEDIEVELHPLADVEARVQSGEITHSLVVAALYHHYLHTR